MRKEYSLVFIILTALIISPLPLYAENAVTTVSVTNSVPIVGVEIAPDDDPAAPGVQVINPDPTTNRTVTISATITDLNGYDDLSIVVANISGPSVVDESPLTLSFYEAVNSTTAIYKGSFNMSTHAEGDYRVAVTAMDYGGSAGLDAMNFTYLYAGQVTIYDFSTGAGVDKWAYRKQHNEKPPGTDDVPGTEFNDVQYNRIGTRDGLMQLDNTNRYGYYAIHRFRIRILTPASEITGINISWYGIGFRFLGTNGASLYVWNTTAGRYELLDRANSIALELNGELSGDIQHYLSDDGCITLIVEQNSPQGRLWWIPLRSVLGTDYIRLEVMQYA